MWLRNYYNMLTASILGDSTLTSTTQPTDYTPPIMIHRETGAWINTENEKQPPSTMSNDINFILRNLFYIGKGNATYLTTIESSLNACVGIKLGTGTTAPTYDDYQMEAPITSGLSVVSGDGTLTTPSTFDGNTHHYSSTRSFTINNTSASSMVISEVGFYVPARYQNITYSAMVYHDVITPITLAPGESVIVSFTRDAEVYNYTPY